MVKRESTKVKRESALEEGNTSKRTRKSTVESSQPYKLEETPCMSEPAACKLEFPVATGSAKQAKLPRKLQDPFPSHPRPSEEECRLVHGALATLHPAIVDAKLRQADEGGCGDRRLVLDALVGTILSQNTTDTNSHRAFCQLKSEFATWEEVRVAPAESIAEAIRSGGLAATKTARIQSILETLHTERGECDMEYLREMDDEAVKAELRRFKGVGAKTISCVLMFCLKRADFPVDTHVWKIAIALGWVPKAADRDQTYEHLNRRVPADIKYESHVLLVEHGKVYKNDVQVLRKAMKADVKSESTLVD